MMINVLHITPHLGGGVGKAIAGLISESHSKTSSIIHEVVILEPLEKSYYREKLINIKCKIYENLNKKEIYELMGKADIVQIEFWNHPLIPDLLVTSALPKARFIIWCHISGLFSPKIPIEIFKYVDSFVFSSACSFKNNKLNKIKNIYEKECQTISSAGGLESMQYKPKNFDTKELRYGYVGTLSFSKIHPNFVKYLTYIDQPNFFVSLYGDTYNKIQLMNEAKKFDRENLLKFEGYNKNIEKILNELDIFVYLLNPYHYGTAENALIEAMSLGVVPIVLNNPAELEIIQDGINGIVINKPEELNIKIFELNNNREYLKELSINAAKFVRNNYSFKISADKFKNIYTDLIMRDKKKRFFSRVFGINPIDWYYSFQQKNQFKNDYMMHIKHEKTKGSIFHFNKYFRNDIKINKLAEIMNNNSISSLQK